jgi:pentatricopeptide repeat protein
MSLLGCNSSTSGTFVSKLATRQVLPFLYPVAFSRGIQTCPRRESRHRRPLQVTCDTAGLEDWFINSLARVASCRKQNTVPQKCTYFTLTRQYTNVKRQRTADVSCVRRPGHSKASPGETAENVFDTNTTREELMALVDDYDGESFTDQLPLIEPPNLYQPSDGPHLTVSDNEVDEWPPPHHAWPCAPDVKAKIALLDRAVKDFSQDPVEVYKLYRDLPAPRAPYLESKTRHRLLRHLSVVERKDEQSMLRYFSVIDDMKSTAIPLSTSEWTSAISFAARYVNKSTEAEVEAALQMWREMEHVVGVKGNDATFNVLFDVACKAGKFTLAEMIYKEMDARGFKFNRFHHVSQIHFYGLKGNGDGARAAYKALVEAGEIVDTVVLNAMISALIQSHEANAAENVYERMKRAHLANTNSRLPPKDFKSRREINLSLLKLAKIAQDDPSKLEEFRQNSIIAPDTQTYRILVNYFAVRAGELDKVSKYLDEMKWFQIPLHGALFLALVKGFALHGGIRYTEWTDDRLERVWKSFLQAIDEGAEDLYISKWMAVWALKAFLKCSGKSRTIDTWEEIRQRWKPSEADMDFIMRTLRPLLDGEDMAEKRFDWLLGPL